MPTDSFFSALVEKLARPETVGITLSGSYARRDATPYSDVDIRHYVTGLREGERAYTLDVIDGYLVSIYTLTLAEEQESLRKPQRAIWAIPGLMQARILFDPHGEMVALIRDAAQTRWADLQAAADVFASEELMGFAEESLKLLGHLARGGESAVTNAAAGMVFGMMRAFATQRGLMIRSENDFLDILQDAAGRDSAWTRAFRLAAVLDIPETGQPPYAIRGAAALALYRETVRLLRPALATSDAAIVDFALERMFSAGY